MLRPNRQRPVLKEPPGGTITGMKGVDPRRPVRRREAVMPYCSSCGLSLSQGAPICPACGSWTAAASAPATDAPVRRPAATHTMKPAMPTTGRATRPAEWPDRQPRAVRVARSRKPRSARPRSRCPPANRPGHRGLRDPPAPRRRQPRPWTSLRHSRRPALLCSNRRRPPRRRSSRQHYSPRRRPPRRRHSPRRSSRRRLPRSSCSNPCRPRRRWSPRRRRRPGPKSPRRGHLLELPSPMTSRSLRPRRHPRLELPSPMTSRSLRPTSPRRRHSPA